MLPKLTQTELKLLEVLQGCGDTVISNVNLAIACDCSVQCIENSIERLLKHGVLSIVRNPADGGAPVLKIPIKVNFIVR